MRTPLEEFFFVMSGTASTLSVVALLGLMVTMVMAWRATLGARRRVDALLRDLTPMLAHATAVSASVRETAALVREDVALVSVGIRETSVRVHTAVADLMQRVDDFNLLLGRVHKRADTVVEVAGVAMDGIAGVWKGLRARKRLPRVRKK